MFGFGGNKSKANNTGAGMSNLSKTNDKLVEAAVQKYKGMVHVAKERSQYARKIRKGIIKKPTFIVLLILK